MSLGPARACARTSYGVLHEPPGLLRVRRWCTLRVPDEDDQVSPPMASNASSLEHFATSDVLSTIHSQGASFLGDPTFPEAIIKADRGEKILQYQKLYQDYTRLNLTYAVDRPIAIGSLQERILGALEVNDGFGAFDEEKPERNGHSQGRGLLRRSLLWCRGADTPVLHPIEFPAKHDIAKVPSWLWMAYTGGINCSPKFGRVDWNALESPWYPSLRPHHTA